MPALSLGTLTPKMTQSWTQFHCWVGPKLERVKQSFLSCRLRERTERQYNELVTALFPGSSMVEHSAVNRRVASSNLARGANLKFCPQLDLCCFRFFVSNHFGLPKLPN